jgi:hypothetical protein
MKKATSRRRAEPSRASLAEIPEVDLRSAKRWKNPS